MKPWCQDKFQEFLITFDFYKLKIILSIQYFVPFQDQDVQISLSIFWKCLKLD